MLHKHHSTHHAAGVILGIVLLGGTLGTVNGVLGNNVAQNASALKGGTLYSQRILDSAHKRRLRRSMRLRNTKVVYPAKTTSFDDYLLSKKLNVALSTGFLSYPRLRIGAPINKPSITEWNNRDWRALENQIQFGLLHGVTAYPHSPPLGGKGNIIIAGHSSAPTLKAMGSAYEDVFAVLPSSELGDLIEVRDSQNNVFTYEVYRAEVVSSRYTQILLQNKNKKDLILFTCYPVGTTRDRFAVWAKLIEEGERVVGR